MKIYDSIFTLKLNRIIGICLISCFAVSAVTESFAAQVVQRVAVASRTAPRANNAARISSATQPVVSNENQTTDLEPVPEETVTEDTSNIIDNKSSQFEAVLSDTVVNSTDTVANSRAQMIMDQRAALDSAANISTAKKTAAAAMASGKNSCDTKLRDCMRQKCDNDFSKCAGDGDTDWGNKINLCRADTNCSGEEFTAFAKEIKADRDYNSKISGYTKTTECGNSYNSCIIKKCGTNFSQCISKSVSDAAIASCASVASGCQNFDNGMTSRIQQVFGTLRANATAQVTKDEARLYELREKMAEQCKTLGAMFDERSLDCVFTVNLFANNSKNPMASKKLYAGDAFDCDQNWFGVDLTTYKENAYRLTREQTAASSAILGAGLGVAAGAISSGAISRAMDTQKAEKAVDAAKKEEGTTSQKNPDAKENDLTNESDISSTGKTDSINNSVNKEQKNNSSEIKLETNRDEVFKQNSEINKGNAEAFEKMEGAEKEYASARDKYNSVLKSGNSTDIKNAENNLNASRQKTTEASSGLKEMKKIEVTSISVPKPEAPTRITSSMVSGGK
ncbi:MAG TPA: hypothetical protein PLZ05_02775 [Alphaproteobacteria bacterium]|nr:hypothetical protein [Alphaproteobacteria bacterium]